MNIPASLIKELRDRTNMGIMDCKKALLKTNGNLQQAVEEIRKNRFIKISNKSKKITKEGIILVQITKNKKKGLILELNCETDFVSKNHIFKTFCKNIATLSLKNEITDLKILKNIFKEETNKIITLFDENINIRRIKHIQGTMIGSYVHNKKIGAILSASNINTHFNNKELLKNISMHIVANNPKYIDIHHIPEDLIHTEEKIQMNIATQLGKPYEIAKKISEGRVNQFINELSLINQPFVMDTKKTIIDLLHENNLTIDNFIRFELGEEI